MANNGEIIAQAAQMGVRYAQRLAAGIPDNRFGRLARPGDTAIEANHPAFLLGHLCLYPLKVVNLLEVDAASVKSPQNYDALFSKDAKCVDDADGKLYPPSKEIVETFNRTYESAISAVLNASDAQLGLPNPIDTPTRSICTTLGSLINFYMTSHVMMHLGQLSTWRRMEGMPPA